MTVATEEKTAVIEAEVVELATITWQEAYKLGCLINNISPISEMLTKEGYIREYKQDARQHHFNIKYDREFVADKMAKLFLGLEVGDKELNSLCSEAIAQKNAILDKEKDAELSKVASILKKHNVTKADIEKLYGQSA